MTKRDVEIILASLKEYVKDLLLGWGLSDEEKSLVAFEQKYMPYTEYSGKQSVDHVLFRKFLRIFNPDEIREAAKADLDKKQDKEDAGLNTGSKFVVGAINELRDIIIATGGNTEATKEVVEVESEEALYTLENPSKEVIYITADTGMLYIYDGNSFINVTNQEVDNTIYVRNINELLSREYTKAGIYTVVYVISRTGLSNSLIYSLNVSQRTSQLGITYTLKLANNDGWADVVTDEGGVQSWDWHYYAYDEDIDALKAENEELRKKLKEVEDLAYAGL